MIAEVDQTSKRQWRCAAARPRGEHAGAQVPGGIHGSFPERRLADAGRTNQDDRASRPRLAYEMVEAREFLLPPDNRQSVPTTSAVVHSRSDGPNSPGTLRSRHIRVGSPSRPRLFQPCG